LGKTKYYWDFGDGNTSNEENPTYTYTRNESYNCSLQVTDNTGEEASDLMTMVVWENRKPTVSIDFITDQPKRPKNFFLEYLLPPFLNTEQTHGANDYRELLDKGRLDPFFRNMDSFYTLEASASDEDGDEIVSYNWTLRPPAYTTRFGGEPKDPEYHFSGKKIEIPAKYIYPSQRYSITLTVTDSAGKNRSVNLKFQVQKSHERARFEGRIGVVLALITLFSTTLPDNINFIWGILNSQGKLSDHIDNNWFDWPEWMQNLVKRFIDFAKIDYEPPLPKADLVASEIADINLSAFVNESGVVDPGAMVSSSFTIVNNETEYAAESIYISLIHPFSEEEGLNDTIEVKNLTVGLDVGPMSNKLFYNGEYTDWDDCYRIEKLAPGASINMGITVTLKEDAIFTKGAYNCTLYMYQEKCLEKHSPVDPIPFTIKL
jgi:PKD repeat protein